MCFDIWKLFIIVDCCFKEFIALHEKFNAPNELRKMFNSVELVNLNGLSFFPDFRHSCLLSLVSEGFPHHRPQLIVVTRYQLDRIIFVLTHHRLHCLVAKLASSNGCSRSFLCTAFFYICLNCFMLKSAIVKNELLIDRFCTFLITRVLQAFHTALRLTNPNYFNTLVCLRASPMRTLLKSDNQR